jgi:phage-related protein
MKINKSWILLFAIALAAFPALAQSTASTQSQTSTSTSAEAKAGKAGVKANAKGSASSQSAAQASAGDKSLDLVSGTTMEAALTKSLDVKKNKVGDEVAAKVTNDVKSDGRVVVPKGSRLLGHVTEAKARSKGQAESALGVTFDRIQMKDGRDLPVNLAVQAVAAAQTTSTAAFGDDGLMSSSGGSGMVSSTTSGAVAPARSSGSSGGGGLLGGVTSTASGATSAISGATSAVGNVAGSAGSTVGGTVNSATQVTGSGSSSAGGLNALGNLTSQSQGVFGLQGLQLSSAASNATEGSLLVSSTRNIHLESGTRMLLRAAGSADAKPKQ